MPLTRTAPSTPLLVLAALALLTAPLAGCLGSSGDDTGPSNETGTAPTGDAQAGNGTNSTMLSPRLNLDRGVLTKNLTVTVNPQDGCIPVGCNAHMATGGEDFLKWIDLSEVLPQGTHAWLEAEATWEETNDGSTVNEMNLQWWGRNSWVSFGTGGAEPGHSWLEGYITAQGSDPAQILLVVIEPENAEPIEVDITLRAEHLVETVAPWHPVTVDLEDPSSIQAVVNESSLEGGFQVRAPDRSLIDEAEFEDGAATVAFPENATSGEYIFNVRADTAAPVSFQVPEDELADETMQMAVSSLQQGEPRVPPSGGEEISWTVEYEKAPYWIGVYIQQLDSWANVQGLEITVEGPTGTLLEITMNCLICGFGISGWGVSPGSEELQPGTYTYTVSADANQDYKVLDVARLYGSA